MLRPVEVNVKTAVANLVAVVGLIVRMTKHGQQRLGKDQGDVEDYSHGFVAQQMGRLAHDARSIIPLH